MEGSSTILLTARNINKSFGTKIILRDFSIEVEAEKNIHISGPSGSGKTTLLRIMALLDRTNGGMIWYRDRDVTSYALSPYVAQALAGICIGFVSQDNDLWPHLTVSENIQIPLRLKGIPVAAVEAATAQVLKALGLECERDNYPAELSGGQRQRCAIARCLVHRPDVLLLDEVTANLDNENVRKVMAAIETAATLGATLVLVSHRTALPTDLFVKRILLS
jgi:ABC-type lipoprotein export system ATPase subunit